MPGLEPHRDLAMIRFHRQGAGRGRRQAYPQSDQEILDLLGAGAEALAKVSGDLLQLRLVGGSGELLVDPKSEPLIRDVARWKQAPQREGHRHLGRRLRQFLALGGQHRLVQEVVVHLHAHGRDVSVLRLPKHVAGPSDLQVPEREREAGAEVLKVGDDVKALVRLLGQGLGRVVQEVGIGALPRAAHPSP